jgi:tetratricopeptide (TPR) repeat protein
VLVAALALLLGGGGAVAWLARTWQETARREAFLPELEAQARARRSMNDERLLALLGARLLRAGEYDQATRAFERAASAGARDASVWLAWAAATAVRGNRPEAQAVLRLGLSRARTDARPHLQVALDRFLALPASAAPAAVAAAISPEEDRLLLQKYGAGGIFNRWVAWWGLRSPETSGFATREAWAKREPRNAQAQRLWGQALMMNRRLPEALTVLEQARALAPDDVETRLALGDVLLRGGAVVQAGREYDACLRARPNWTPALIGAGNVALEKKLLLVATDLFERATKQAPDSADAWIGLGRAYAQFPSRREPSVRAFEKAARLAPDRTDFFFFYADALRLNVRLDEAEAVLRRRLKRAPNEVRCSYLLSFVLMENKPSDARTAEAEQVLRASLPHAPDYGLFAVRLGQLLMQHGQAQETVSLLQPLFESRPSPYTGTAMMLLARAYRRLGRHDEARAAQQRSIAVSRYTQQLADLADRARRDPYNPSAHRELARLLQSGGDIERARKHARIADTLLATTSRESATKASPSEGSLGGNDGGGNTNANL